MPRAAEQIDGLETVAGQTSQIRPIRQRRRSRHRWLLPQASGSQARLQVPANRPASKHIGVSRDHGSRAAGRRSWRRDLGDLGMRTFGDEQVCGRRNESRPAFVSRRA